MNRESYTASGTRNASLTTAYTCGVFDHFHIGHLNFIREAYNCGLLTVGIQDDRDVFAGKGVHPTFPLADRLAIVGSLCYVSKVISYRNTDQSEFLKAERPTYFVVGEEYGNDDRFPGQVATLVACQELGIIVKRITRTENISSTMLRYNARQFWNTYSALHANDPSDSITTLTQEDPEITRQEVDWILNHSGTGAYEWKHILDLGAGDGRLARPLADKVAFVHCIEPQELLIKRSQSRSTPYQAAHLGYVKTDALTHLGSIIEAPVETVLISGLLPYLTDDEVRLLGELIKKKVHSSLPTRIILREPMSTKGYTIHVVSQASATLGYIPYTATYRTLSEVLYLLNMEQVCAEQVRHTHKDTAIYLVALEF